jgi:hypothetical protein
VLGVRGDEHHRRRLRALAQLVGELRAVAAGHRDVEQHDVAGLRRQPHQRLRHVGGLADHARRRRRAGRHQRAQPQPRELLVVDQQDPQRFHRHSGTTI